MSNIYEKGIKELEDLIDCDYVYAKKMWDKIYTLIHLSFDLYKKELKDKSGK